MCVRFLRGKREVSAYPRPFRRAGRIGKEPPKPMRDAEKSDALVVPMKLANKTAHAVAEPVEGSGAIERSAGQQSTVLTQSGVAVSQALSRIRGAVTGNKSERLTSLLHHVTVDCLRVAFFRLKKRAAPGVDGVTWEQYAAELDSNLQGLHARVHCGAYRAQPSRRRMIPKADGRQRPLGIAALEDKIVQMAVVLILTPVYESEFLGFSYGFRPGRSQHDALDALAYAIKARKVCWVFDADISRYFDTLKHDWLMRFLKHRIGDRRLLRLIQKWLKAGVMDEGQFMVTEEGTPQGSVISPLLSNVYLHYCYDLWVNRWRKHQATGDVVVIRYADDTIVGFQHYHDALKFRTDLQHRLATFGLTLHPEKTRLIEFGKFAAERRARRGQDKPETFNFLGFTHICSVKQGKSGFQLMRKTRRERLQAKLQEVKAELRRHVHASIDEQGRWLGSVIRGFFAYFAVPTNVTALSAFKARVKVLWIRRLRRRSQRHRMTWARMQLLADKYLPAAAIRHPWPEERFRVKYSR